MTLLHKQINLDQIVLFNDLILIKPLKDVNKTSGGIFLPPGMANNTTAEGYIMKIGPGYPIAVETESYDKTPKTIPLQAQIQDLALFSLLNAREIKYKDEVYYIVRECDILLVERGLIAD